MQLGLQHVEVPEQEPDSALGEGGIARGRERKIRQDLVAAQVDQTEDDISRMHPLRRPLEELELLVLGGEGAADGKGELRPVQADPVGVVEERGLGIGELVHVRQQRERRAVERHRGEVDQPAQPLLRSAQVGGEAVVLALDGALRIDEDDPRHSVDDDPIARLDLGQHGRHARHRRRSQRAREDRAVGKLVAPSGDEGAHVLQLQARRHRGQELVRDDDRAVRDLRPGAVRLHGERGQEPPAHVVDVRRPPLQEGVLRFIEVPRVILEDLGDGRFHVDALLLHLPQHPIAQGDVLQDQLLHREDVRFAGADPLPHTVLQGAQLRLGPRHRRVEAPALAVQFRRADVPLWDGGAVAAAHDEGRALGHSGGNPDPLQHDPLSRPRRRV